MPRALLEGRGDGAFIRLGDAMTATPEQHVHNFFAAHGKLGGAFLCANGAPCMVMDARMLRALDVQTKAMGQYIAQCGDDADPTRADTLVNMIAAEGLRVDLLAAVPGSALLEDTHGFSGLAIFDIDVHDNSPAGSVSFTLGGAAIAATLANERDAAADAMEAAPWASCDAYGGTQFNSVTIRRWASVKYIHVPKYYHISSWPPCVPTAPSTNKQLLSSPPRRAYQFSVWAKIRRIPTSVIFPAAKIRHILTSVIFVARNIRICGCIRMKLRQSTRIDQDHQGAAAATKDQDREPRMPDR